MLGVGTSLRKFCEDSTGTQKRKATQEMQPEAIDMSCLLKTRMEGGDLGQCWSCSEMLDRNAHASGKCVRKERYDLPVVPHKAVAEASTIGNL